jgi:hypothetical protein
LRKLLSALLEDDFQGFFNKEVDRSEISGLISDENLEEWLVSEVCEGGFQYITDADVAATECWDVEENGRAGGKKKETVIMFFIAWHYSVSMLWKITWVHGGFYTVMFQP